MIPPIANRFVAGEDCAAAIGHAADLNRDGIGAIINRLGEHYGRAEPARADRDAYLRLVDRIAVESLEAVVSVKPSQLGLRVGADLFRDNLRAIVRAADQADGFVWIDMEDHTTTDATIDAFEEFATAYGGRVGICLQSNLKRTRSDLERLAGTPGKVRLVKGAYDEPASIAYTTRQRINQEYRGDLEYAFREFESGIAVGSHDPEIVAHAIDLYESFGADFEFQMLMGVREDEQRRLVDEGYDVWQYVPYGSKWASYFWRRLRERKENFLFALRAILG